MRLLLPAILLVFVPLAAAQNAVKTPPPGWKEYSPKDKSFTVWLPAQGRSSESEQTMTAQGRKSRFVLVQCDVNNGMKLMAAAIHFPTALDRQADLQEAINVFRDVLLGKLNARIEGEAEIKQGKITGREFLFQAVGRQGRLVVYVTPKCLYQMVLVGTQEQVEGPDANIFLDSFKMQTGANPALAKKGGDPSTTPKTAGTTTPKSTTTAKKTDASSPAKTGATTLVQKSKTGAQTPAKAVWNLDVSMMTFPEGLAAGKIKGRDFVVQTTKFESNGALTLRQGTGFFPDAAIVVFLFGAGQEGLAGKTFEIAAEDTGQRPHIHVTRMEEGKKLPTTKIYLRDYAMKLEFGDEKNGVVLGRIYLSVSDPEQTVVAGSFQVRLR